MQTVPYFLNQGMIELVGEIQSLIDDEVIEADAETGDRRRVIRDHSEAEGNGQQQIGEVIEMEQRAISAAGGAERAFDAEPDDQNDGEPAKHVHAHALKERRVLAS